MAWLPQDWKDAQAAAHALATALNAKGFTTKVHKDHGHIDRPCVAVSSGRHRLVDVTRYAYVAPIEGIWWFWLAMSPADLEPIEPASEVSAAADRIGRAVAAIPRAGLRAVP
jgi:hypothetical protein